MTYEKQLNQLIKTFVKGVRDLVASGVVNKINKNFGGKPIKVKKKLKTKVDMQCRHTNKSGERCENPSTGPRFHYLCKDHR